MGASQIKMKILSSDRKIANLVNSCKGVRDERVYRQNLSSILGELSAQLVLLANLNVALINDQKNRK